MVNVEENSVGIGNRQKRLEVMRYELTFLLFEKKIAQPVLSYISWLVFRGQALSARGPDIFPVFITHHCHFRFAKCAMDILVHEVPIPSFLSGRLRW